MKKLILLLAVTLVVFSCSKDTIDTETTADLTQMTPSKSLDGTSEGMYHGVFGHNSVKELHGKILINAGNNGKYSALIQMVNGENIRFQGDQISRTNIHFTSDRGNFDFNTVDITAPVASNVTIDGVEAYIVTIKSRGGGIPVVALGTYEEAGNETNFYGNWDVIGDETTVGPFNSPPFQVSQLINMVVVSPQGTGGPFIDSIMEPTTMPVCVSTATEPFIIEVGPGVTVDIWLQDQVATFKGRTANYSINYQSGSDAYIDIDCNPLPFGSWSWNGRSGTIFGTPLAPTSPTPSVNTTPSYLR